MFTQLFLLLFPVPWSFSVLPKALYSPGCLYPTYSGLLQGLLPICRGNYVPTSPDQTDGRKPVSHFSSLPLSAVHPSRFLLVLLGVVLNLWTVSSCGFWAFFGAFIFLWVCTELLEISLEIMGCVFSNDFNGVFGEERSRCMCLRVGSGLYSSGSELSFSLWYKM